MIGTIYKISSDIDSRVYIGMTQRDVFLRWGEHKTELKRGRHGNAHLQNFYNKYGNQLSFSILEERDFEDLNEMKSVESEYIKLFDSFKSGFNLTTGGEGLSGGRGRALLTDEQAESVKRYLYFGVYEVYKLALDLSLPENTVREIKKGLCYKYIRLKFDSYDQYEKYRADSRKYRYLHYIELIELAYDYIVSNPDSLEYPTTLQRRTTQLYYALGQKDLANDPEFKHKVLAILDYRKRRDCAISKQSNRKCREILTMYLEGYNTKEIAIQLCYDQSHINKVVNNKKFVNKEPELRRNVLRLKEERVHAQNMKTISDCEKAIQLKRDNPNIYLSQISNLIGVDQTYLRAVLHGKNRSKITTEFHEAFRELWGAKI